MEGSAGCPPVSASPQWTLNIVCLALAVLTVLCWCFKLSLEQLERRIDDAAQHTRLLQALDRKLTARLDEIGQALARLQASKPRVEDGAQRRPNEPQNHARQKTVPKTVASTGSHDSNVQVASRGRPRRHEPDVSAPGRNSNSGSPPDADLTLALPNRMEPRVKITRTASTPAQKYCDSEEALPNPLAPRGKFTSPGQALLNPLAPRTTTLSRASSHGMELPNPLATRDKLTRTATYPGEALPNPLAPRVQTTRTDSDSFIRVHSFSLRASESEGLVRRTTSRQMSVT